MLNNKYYLNKTKCGETALKKSLPQTGKESVWNSKLNILQRKKALKTIMSAR